MKKWIFLFVFYTFSAWGQFLPGTEDIPFMKGLEQVEETASFDNPEERMVLISAETKLSKEKVFQFYKQVLQNLGWVESGPGYFERGKDVFSIEINAQKQIQFRLRQSNL